MPNSKAPEKTLWKWLSSARKVFKDRLHIDRVENSVLQGMSDVNGCISGIDFWIELKCEARPASPDTKITVRFEPSQIPWMEKRRKAGGRVFVLLQVGSGHLAARYLIPGMSAHKLRDGLTEKEMRDYAIRPPDKNAVNLLLAAIGC